MPQTSRTAVQANKTSLPANIGKGILTRSKLVATKGEKNVKRKAESPGARVAKRSACGDITNNTIGKSSLVAKKPLKNVTNISIAKDTKTLTKPTVKPHNVSEALTNILTRRTVTTAAAVIASNPVKSSLPEPTISKAPVEETVPEVLSKKDCLRSSTRLSMRSSLDSSNSENSLYVSALEDTVNLSEEKKDQVVLPPGVEDFDGLDVTDPHLQASDYVFEIFEYLKKRESMFKVGDYMDKQVSLSRWMRSLLVDWLVEVQENFELNHETLYLAVKIVDTYLSKVVVMKEKLQLVGAASMFIASKFDERMPPLIDDLIYICDGAYTHDQLIKMEMSILRVIDFDLSMPLSYRFLRRYARCAHIEMKYLTLARYILESSLLEYSMVMHSESKLAAAALLLALRMQNLGTWTPTLQYYSGYKVDDFKDICHELNDMLLKKPKSALSTVRNKYSHKVFFEVAKLPVLEHLDL